MVFHFYILSYYLDHPQHNVPILGGMWGFANYRNREQAIHLFSLLIDRKIAHHYNKKNNSLVFNDQRFLRDIYWPIAKKNATIHASFFCNKYGAKSIPFPTQRPKYYCFVPCAYCCNEKLNNKTWTDECGRECRSDEHKDWLYC